MGGACAGFSVRFETRAADDGCSAIEGGPSTLAPSSVTKSRLPAPGQVIFIIHWLGNMITSKKIFTRVRFERGIGAMISTLASKQLRYPSSFFEMVHCSRCRVDWHENDGILLKEMNHLLRSNGYPVYSAPPNYRKYKHFPLIWNKLVDLTSAMWWKLIG